MKIRWKNPLHYFDQIYLINLDRRTDRLEQSIKEFLKVGMPNPKRISGVEHENHALGCHLSHMKCFDDAIREGHDRILIFEDDVEFFPNALENLTQSLKELPKDWDMFYLGANLDRFPAYEVSLHLAKLVGAYATHAYATRRRMFPILHEINRNTDIPHNDVYYAENIHPYYNCYLAVPLVAGQRESYSDIQGKVMSSNEVFQSRLKSNLVLK